MLPIHNWIGLTAGTPAGSIDIDSSHPDIIAMGPATVQILEIYGESAGKGKNTGSIDLIFVPNPCPNAVLDNVTINDMTTDVFTSVT